MIRFTGVHSQRIDDVWPEALPLLRRGFESPEIADLFYFKVKATQAQLWCAYDDDRLIAACLTELPIIGGRKVCNIMSVGGTGMRRWLQYLDTIEAWARSNDCVAMRHENARPGWARVLKSYHTAKITLEKAL